MKDDSNPVTALAVYQLMKPTGGPAVVLAYDPRRIPKEDVNRIVKWLNKECRIPANAVSVRRG